jgi:hypothetical protein
MINFRHRKSLSDSNLFKVNDKIEKKNHFRNIENPFKKLKTKLKIPFSLHKSKSLTSLKSDKSSRSLPNSIKNDQKKEQINKYKHFSSILPKRVFNKQVQNKYETIAVIAESKLNNITPEKDETIKIKAVQPSVQEVNKSICCLVKTNPEINQIQSIKEPAVYCNNKNNEQNSLTINLPNTILKNSLTFDIDILNKNITVKDDTIKVVFSNLNEIELNNHNNGNRKASIESNGRSSSIIDFEVEDADIKQLEEVKKKMTDNILNICNNTTTLNNLEQKAINLNSYIDNIQLAAQITPKKKEKNEYKQVLKYLLKDKCFMVIFIFIILMIIFMIIIKIKM